MHSVDNIICASLTTDGKIGWFRSGCSSSVGHHTAVFPLVVAEYTANGEGIPHTLNV